MSIKLTANKNNPPIGGIAAAHLIQDVVTVEISWGSESSVSQPGQEVFKCNNNNDVLRAMARAAPAKALYGKSALESSQVDHWLTYVLTCNLKEKSTLAYLDKCIAPLTFLCGNTLTIADLALYNEMHWYAGELQSAHLKRWFDLIRQQPAVQTAIKLLPADAQRQKSASPARTQGERKQEGKFVELPGAEMGKVVVRFPPEASGFLHIGHAKAALLNQYYAQAFEGTLIMRFDDTNPAKETVEFEEVILEDLKLLNIKPDIFTHTSNYFDLMLSYCEQLINEGRAYVDDTPPEQMKAEREQRTESTNRANSVEKNMQMWKEMLAGSAKGQKCCVRAKIDMSSANGCMRDPTIYRCKNEPHPRTGTKYKVYPTYDFACPIVDAIENVTHTLRTMEYHDRDDQFYWFIDALKLRKPYIWEYSRLNMTNTVLSKRKLTWFVDEGLVDGWDDPRFPTVRGVLRRGMTVEGLREFIIAQGSSKSVVFMNWDKIWAFNKKVIDPIAPRYTALEHDNRIVVNVEGAKYEKIEVALHPKNENVGKKWVTLGPRIYVDYEDAIALKEGENATFINWGNLLIKKIQKDTSGRVTSIDAALNLENKDFKKTLKLTWLAVEEADDAYPPCWCVYFDNIISKPVLGKDEDFKSFIGHKTREEIQMLGDPELKHVKKGDIIQLQRRGFFKVDNAYAAASPFSGVTSPVILFSVPDGHTKDMPSSGLKINTATVQETTKNAAGSTSPSDGALNEKINKQGDLIRDLKKKKAAKSEIEPQVKILLDLKAQYKQLTGNDWKPDVIAPAAPVASVESSTKSQDKVSEVLTKITEQGDKVRQLKAQKAEKSLVDEAVKGLLGLKAEYKQLTGSDWKPGVTAPVAPVAAVASSSKSQDKVAEVLAKITEQGDKVRQLKAQKAEKSLVDEAVKGLLGLKAEYKKLTGSDWKPGVTAPVAPVAAVASSPKSQDKVSEVLAKITEQGDKVRQLKAQKAEKSLVDEAVKGLLGFKAEYKQLTGSDWKPGVTAPVAPVAAVASSPQSQDKVSEVLAKITEQGDKVRQLKAQKAEKSLVDEAVKGLLGLKAEYKQLTGSDWKPGVTAPVAPVAAVASSSKSQDKVAEVLAKITEQGDNVRQLKAQKAEKSLVDEAVKGLLGLKAEYKQLTGSDWKPNVDAAKITIKKEKSPEIPSVVAVSVLLQKISEQGDKIRSLKSAKSDKKTIESEVQLLLALKADYKSLTGTEWKPDTVAAVPATTTTIDLTRDSSENNEMSRPAATEKDLLTQEITAQGEKVRVVKSSGVAKEQIEEEVKKLLALKAKYKEVTGTDFPVAGRSGGAVKKSSEKKDGAKATKSVPAAKKEPVIVDASSGGPKKQTRLGLEAKKCENLPDWYSQVITKGELIDYYDVSGCYILRPWSFGIWRRIRDWFDGEITKMGIKEVYFPMFVSRQALEREKTHIADFAPEVAWVTKSGETDLAEPIAVRPTSETVIYPTFAKWVQSYRDLPIRINQWSNVVRWEFKHPQPFLRTREFLWQEGHTAWAHKADADKEVLEILDFYAKVYTDLMAIPVVKGTKTKKEKFAGADYTTTVEAFISASGRAIQGATSHHLGQNFSKMFDIVFEDPETQQKQFVYQNSWGITTRTIGVMIMVHADDQGLVLPPHVATVQAIIVPCGITVNTKDSERAELLDACKKLEKQLLARGIRCEGDYRDNYSPGWKFNHWELKGVPVRIEVGPKDLKASQIVAVRRDTAEKLILALENVDSKIHQLLETIHDAMYLKAQKELYEQTKLTKSWNDFCNFLDQKNILLAPFCGEIDCEGKIKADSAREELADAGAPAMGAKGLCIPFEQPAVITAADNCIHPGCIRKPQYYTLFGRSY